MKCSACLEDKPNQGFAKGRQCKACRNGYAKAWRDRNKDKLALKHRARMFRRNIIRGGLTVEEYYDLLDWQEYRCGICRTEYNEAQRFIIDHDHSNGTIRGLLCTRCNTGLGMFRDDLQIFQNAVDYLVKSKDKPAPDIDHDQVAQLYRDGLSETVLAIHYGTTAAFIHEILVKHGVERRPAGTR